MRNPNPRADVRRNFGPKPPKLHNLESLHESRELTENLLNKLISIENRLDTDEFKWFTEEYLPAMSLQIAVEAFENNDDPKDENFEKNMAFENARIFQNKWLTGKLKDVRSEIIQTKSSISEIQQAIDDWHRKKEKTHGRNNT